MMMINRLNPTMVVSSNDPSPTTLPDISTRINTASPMNVSSMGAQSFGMTFVLLMFWTTSFFNFRERGYRLSASKMMEALFSNPITTAINETTRMTSTMMDPSMNNM
jgi:hypothetical protein